MKQDHILLGIAGIAAIAGIYFLVRASKSNGEDGDNGPAPPPDPTVAFVPDTIYRGHEVTVVWENFDDGVLGLGTLYTSWGYAVYSYESYDGSGSIVFSGSLTQQLMAGEYTLVVKQESVNKRAEAKLTVI